MIQHTTIAIYNFYIFRQFILYQSKNGYHFFILNDNFFIIFASF